MELIESEESEKYQATIDAPRSIDNLEKSVKDLSKKDEVEQLIDLNDGIHLGMPYIIFLIESIDKKISEGVDIQLKIPEDENKRNSIRYFRLPSIIANLTGKKFRDIITEDSLKYFGENINLKRNCQESLRTQKYENFDTLADALKTKDICVFCESMPFKDDFEKICAVEKLHSIWTDAEMRAFLKRHLDSPDYNKERFVSNRIIYECATNSQRHSEANKLLVAAVVKKTEIMDNNDCYKYTLDIYFWDNGKSIIETLKNAHGKGQPIRNNMGFHKDIRNFHASYSIKYENSPFDKIIINSDVPDETPANESESGISMQNILNDDGLILLSSFFPGVSEDPRGSSHKENPEFKQGDSPLKYPGMGLTTLLNAAIDLLDGQVSVRAGDYFLNIKKLEDSFSEKLKKIEDAKYKKYYQAEINKIEDKSPQLNGNMLIVSLPLKRE
ncbi:MAG: hypothetical protein LBK58_15585 [Prevotellaceae bacterium]|jgi:hypothetical protein|nr:hypothetical protein [Prevotellaceae bacterium]